jgi:hypothetical protein
VLAPVPKLKEAISIRQIRSFSECASGFLRTARARRLISLSTTKRGILETDFGTGSLATLREIAIVVERSVVEHTLAG